ncbi:MAG: mechanosensitive ion channel [Bacteroidia bacterium]|nr:mechanosensitive ion channel [Bacteroidia bacterium]MBT8279888.1 mechanosensitive ion channel [Bacteroidia bacterium]NNK60702.1 mechanosensitive ion channel [Flavobacteriaceae bacterium]
MENLDKYKEIIIDGFMTTGITVGKALIILLIGWLILKVILFVLKKVLKAVKIDALGDKINELEVIEGKKLNVNLTKIILSVVKWVYLLLLIIIVAEVLGLTIISEELGNLISYLPILISALVIFMIGLFIATLAKNAIKSMFKSLEISGSKIISNLVFLILMIIVSITALNQAGIDTEIITSNMTLIFGAFLGAFALALGLGARGVVADLLRTFYTRRTYELGQHIKFNKVEGEIIAIDDISMTLKTDQGKLVIPVKDIVENQVEIQG